MPVSLVECTVEPADYDLRILRVGSRQHQYVGACRQPCYRVSGPKPLLQDAFQSSCIRGGRRIVPDTDDYQCGYLSGPFQMALLQRDDALEHPEAAEEGSFIRIPLAYQTEDLSYVSSVLPAQPHRQCVELFHPF